MIANSIYFMGHRCFNNEWSGFQAIKPINVIIGRNNSGKSHLLDLVESVCEKFLIGNELMKRGCRFKAYGVLEQQDLIEAFPPNVSGGLLGGNHWNDHGKLLVGAHVNWEIDPTGEPSNISLSDNTSDSRAGNSQAGRITKARADQLIPLLKNTTHKLSGTTLRKLLSERDIRPEKAQLELELTANGEGATNVVRRFMLSSNDDFPREFIQDQLRDGLNTIFGHDGHFLEIQPIFHDESDAEGPKDYWEVYLGEENKGIVPLSKSGSGLKTVLLVLLNLIAIPRMTDRNASEFTFAFEELENNLHPALLRRLFKYLEEYAVQEKVAMFLTTHSSTALDCFGTSSNAQIVHVIHNGETARTEAVTAQIGRINVVHELGAKPSDLLQANGIIWVEGPSDRIYINRWIELYADGLLHEGRDYQCAHYGGALLSRIQFTPSEDANPDLANLFVVNPNVVVVCDGDRSRLGARLKNRVKRIFDEVSRAPRGHIWITKAREIENYLPGSVLAIALGSASLPDPEPHEQLFPRTTTRGKSYLERNLGKKAVDKVDLALLSTPHMTKETMKGRFDWESQMKEIVARVKAWND